MKSVLFVINTLGIGGGEKALIELFKQIDLKKYDISLLVLTGQGELLQQIPEGVNLMNDKYYPISVLDYKGKIRLFITIMEALFVKGTIVKRIRYILDNLTDMKKRRNIQIDKLFWKVLSDGAQKLEQKYDLAVAYLEGGATYYVSSYVKAKRKVAFIHVNYISAGYSRKLDENCYLNFERVFAVSESTKEVFLSVYPECHRCTDVFYNLLDRENIIYNAKQMGGFSDDFNGFRILTVGRLVPQKAHEVAVNTMKILKLTGKSFRWYVLGEGELRKRLEKQIHMLGLDEDFILLGTVDNPFPYYAQCDLYVHTACFEGKSIAVQEAQILGCAILATDYDGVREQIEDGVDGRICKLESKSIAENILDLANNPQTIKKYGIAASRKEKTDNQIAINKFIELI